MDRTVPAGAALLLDFIGDTEAPNGYGTIFGNNQDRLPKPITSMTLAEVQRSQGTWSKKFGSSATGRYQFMKATLADLIVELKLSTAQKLDADLQDRLAFHLLKRRGYELYISGKINLIEFGKRLAQEWASFPVLADCQGAHRQLKRGQSYYAGDGLNKALVKPEKVETVLKRVWELSRMTIIDTPAPSNSESKPAQSGPGKVIVVIPDTPKPEPRNRFLAWLLGLFFMIFDRRK